MQVFQMAQACAARSASQFLALRAALLLCSVAFMRRREADKCSNSRQNQEVMSRVQVVLAAGHCRRRRWRRGLRRQGSVSDRLSAGQTMSAQPSAEGPRRARMRAHATPSAARWTPTPDSPGHWMCKELQNLCVLGDAPVQYGGMVRFAKYQESAIFRSC